MSVLLTNGLYSEYKCHVAPKVSSVFQKGCKLSSTGCIRREFQLGWLSRVCVFVCFICCICMAHKHRVEHIFSCFYREIYSKSCYSLSKMLSLCLSSLILISSLKGHFSHFPKNFLFCLFTRKKENICTLYVSLSHVFLTPSPLFALSAWVRWPSPTPQPVASGRVVFQSCGALAFSSSWVK